MTGLAFEVARPSVTAGKALEAYRMVKLSGTSYIYTDAGEEPIGMTSRAVAAGGKFALTPINETGVKLVTGAKAIAAGAAIYPANDGKVSDTPSAGRRIGTMFSAITADGGQAAAMLNVFSDDLLPHCSSVIRFFEDFITGSAEDGHKFSETANKADWLKSSTDGSTGGADVCQVADDGPGGILQLTCNAADADNENLQINGEAFKLAAGKPLWFETKVALLDVSACDFFIGLAIADVDVLGGVTDRVGFEQLHDGNIDAVAEQNGTQTLTDTTSDIADCAAIASFGTLAKKLGFYWDGVKTVTFYVDGVAMTTITDNGTTIVIPDDEALTPTIQIKTHTSAGAVQTAFVDYVSIVAER